MLSSIVSTTAFFSFVYSILLQEKKAWFLSCKLFFYKQCSWKSPWCRHWMQIKHKEGEIDRNAWAIMNIVRYLMFCKPFIIWPMLCLKQRCILKLTPPKSTTANTRLFSLPLGLSHRNLNSDDLLRQCFLFSFNCEAFLSGSNLKVWL